MLTLQKLRKHQPPPGSASHAKARSREKHRNLPGGDSVFVPAEEKQTDVTMRSRYDSNAGSKTQSNYARQLVSGESSPKTNPQPRNINAQSRIRTELQRKKALRLRTNVR